MILATALALLAIEITTSTVSLMGNFGRLEKDNVNTNLQRAANAVDRQLQALDASAADWAMWDDTYAFVRDGNQAYVRANLTDATFDYLQLNIIAIVDTAGQVVAVKAYDLNEQVPMPVSGALFESLSDTAIIGHNSTDSKLQCILPLPEASLLVASRPITTSKGEGPIRGTLVMGRYLDYRLLQSLGETTLLHVSAYSTASPSVPDDVTEAMRSLVNEPRLVKPVNENLVVGYLLLDNVAGEPYLVLKIEMPRPIHAQATALLTSNFIFTTMGWLVFLLVLLVFLRKTVLSRLRSLSRAVVAVGESGNLVGVPVDGTDELGVLGNEINSTFTKLINSQIALKDSERKYAALVENSNDGIIMIQDGRLTYANRRVFEVTGFKMSEMVGRPFIDFVASADRARTAENYRIRLAGGTVPSRYEVAILHKDGHEVPVEIGASVVELDGEKRDMAIVHDISARKWAEKRLSQQRELIDRIIAAIPDPVFVVGEGQRIELANRAFRELFRLGPAELEGKAVSQVLIEPALLAAISRGLAGELVEERQIWPGPEGGRLDMHVRAIKMQTNEVLVLLHDLTADIEKDNRLMLTDRLASVGEMASGLAHELNNPLTGVIGLSQLLLADGLPPEIRQDVEDINKEAQRAAAVVKNLLMFARKHAPVREITQINSVIEDVLKLRAYEQKVNNIVVDRRLATDLPTTTADRFQLQQVFLNIILNAEQAMVEAHGRGRLTITTEKVGGDINVSFADDGPGIPPQNLRRVFDPFYTTKEVGKGTGLGLSICFGIVSAHGGRIWAESELGKGATFMLQIPIKDEL